MDLTGKLPFLLRALIVGEALFGLVGVFDGFFVSFHRHCRNTSTPKENSRLVSY